MNPPNFSRSWGHQTSAYGKCTRESHEAAVRQQRLVPDGQFAMFRSDAPMKLCMIVRPGSKLCQTTSNSSSFFPSIKKHMSTTRVRTYCKIINEYAEWNIMKTGMTTYPRTKRTMLFATVLLPMSMSISKTLAMRGMPPGEEHECPHFSSHDQKLFAFTFSALPTIKGLVPTARWTTHGPEMSHSVKQ